MKTHTQTAVWWALAVVLTCVWGAAADTVTLKAGAGTAVITPEKLKPALIGVMGCEITDVSHDIHARALTLYDGKKRLVIITYDLNCLDVATPILRKRCRDELGIDPAYLVLLATHNHAAPIQIAHENFAYGRTLSDVLFKLIQDAIESERGPAQVHFGSGAAYFLKGLGNAPLDHEVQVLKVTVDEKPLAVLFNHPTHPLQVKDSDHIINPGHPGYAVEAIERRIPGATALYTDACGGNQFTQWMMHANLNKVKAVGEELAEVVMSVVDGPMQDVTGALHSNLEVIPLPLGAPIPYEQAKELAKHYPMGVGFVPYPKDERPDNWLRNLIRYYEEDIPFPRYTTDMVCTDDGFLLPELEKERDYPCVYEETIVSRIGKLVFVAMQGEVCAPIGMRIKDTFRYEHPIMVTAYMGEHNLYIPTRELVRKNYYQAKVIQIQYASPVPWALEVENAMVAAVNKLVRKSLAPKSDSSNLGSAIKRLLGGD